METNRNAECRKIESWIEGSKDGRFINELLKRRYFVVTNKEGNGIVEYGGNSITPIKDGPPEPNDVNLDDPSNKGKINSALIDKSRKKNLCIGYGTTIWLKPEILDEDQGLEYVIRIKVSEESTETLIRKYDFSKDISSPGYEVLPESFKRKIRLTESELIKLIQKVIKEDEMIPSMTSSKPTKEVTLSKLGINEPSYMRSLNGTTPFYVNGVEQKKNITIKPTDRLKSKNCLVYFVTEKTNKDFTLGFDKEGNASIR